MKKNTVALMTFLLIAWCGETYGGDSGIELAKEQVFRKNNGAEPGTLDPHRAEGVPASNILRDLFEGLVAELPNGKYIPGVAESWTVSEDSKKYVFKIRKNAKWSNGDKLTAQDYVFSLRRSVDPKTLSNYSSMLYPIRNARNIVKASGVFTAQTLIGAAVGSKTITIIPTEKLEIGDSIKLKAPQDLSPEIQSGLEKGDIEEKDLPELKSYKIKDLGLATNKNSVTLSFEDGILIALLPGSKIYRAVRPKELGVRAEDQRTLIVELEEPTPYFLSLLTHSTTYPVHKASVEKLGSLFTRPGNLISNGAFKLEEWRVQSHIKLVRNTQYWDNQNTTLNEVYNYTLDEPNSALKRYRAKELDFTDTTPLEQLPLIRACMANEYRVAPYFGSYYYGYNNTKPPFKNNPNLRTALNMAIDREILVNIVIGAGQIPAYSFVPPVKTFQPIEPEWSSWTQEERATEALRLYKKAGYSKDKPLEIEILYNTSENHKKVALAVAAMWKQNLGVQTTLRNQEWKVFLETRRLKNETQIFRGGWIGDYDDPYTFSQLLHSENEMNHPGYNSAKYNALIDLAATKNAGENRLDDLRAAEQLLMKDLPIIPLYYYVSQHMIKPWVLGLEDNVMDHHYSKYVKILKKETTQQ